jgi:RNA polymerase sigma-70 factor (ECF subfamily)
MFTVDRNVELAAAGDMTAFEELYKSHYRRVYSLCARMTWSVSEAEDLTQQVFIQVFRKLKTFRGEALFTTWLHRLTVNEVLMHFRKPIVKMEKTTEDGTTPIEIERAVRSTGRISLLDHISLKEAIQMLAPGYRTVFILHDVAGYEHEQIGQILGCAAGTSKSQLHKARLKLRQLLTKQTPSQLSKQVSRAQPLRFKLRQGIAMMVVK